ncbi:WD40 repeat domain-containing serine/threonine protein kinase [Tengunoibacter tsumagoiensis]|uniref:Protein kinase domain-containing protein n=1 Tax=Tengunoibacter tsumagoiensis TaxID=2014871 RepID=A0A401ZTL3_9CHLR|nr:serine/threonine-protein kinase [Tengunoibacter tsumagoiensis]GCE10258.1 hypothetical protein KTT_01170 [Tengunoibacter tsumagoiensis]
MAADFFCDICGAHNRLEAQFCRFCGQPLHTLSASLTSTKTGLLAPQAMLKQRYIVHGQAGRGGFGAVYKASDTEFGHRLVAIKEMSQSTLEPQELVAALDTFRHEALLLASLTHPNLPRIYEQFMDSGRAYLVMDFIEGETLEQQLQKSGTQRLPLSTVFDIALQLCSVLEYLHTRQPPIIFRDLKPANVMLTPTGHLFLIDFGIARHFKPGQEKDTMALGSSGYAPPEQYGKSQTTLRADIYSLGATLHQLLSGNDPTDSPFHFAPLHFSDPALSGLAPLIMSMVSVDPSQRPADILTVSQELQRILNAMTISKQGALSGSFSHSLAGLPVRTLPSEYQTPRGADTQSIPATQTTVAKKRTQKTGGQAQVYPQANTLYICLGHASRITTVAWSPDGKLLASASYDKTAQIWNGANGSHQLTYSEHNARINSLVWSPDSRLVATASDSRTVHLWEAGTGKTIAIYRGHQGPLTSVAWSPDGKLIASAGDDKSIHVWQADTQELLVSYTEHTDRVQALAWSPDGRYLASAGRDKIIKIWEPRPVAKKRSLLAFLFSSPFEEGPQTLKGYEGQIYALAWSPDSRELAAASSDRQVHIHSLHKGAKGFTLKTNDATIKNTIAWSSGGKHLALGGNDKLVHVWNVQSREQSFTYFGHAGYVMSVAWSPDNSRIASAGVDRSIHVWQAV